MNRLIQSVDLEMALPEAQTLNFKLVLMSGTQGIQVASRTLAALADAHDEHMLIVRMADADRVDQCEMQQEVFRSPV